MKANKPDIVKEFVKAINADTAIVHKFDEDMVQQLENELIRLNFISVTNKQEFMFDESIGWRSFPLEQEFYLIQPAIKYYHLMTALDFVQSNEYYNNLSEAGKQYVMDKLDSKIRGDMTEQIVIYEVSKALPSDKYSVCKTIFSNTDSNKAKGEYDMLVYDKQKNCYFAFEIKHTSEPYYKQCSHLLNESFKQIIDYKYGDKKNVCVLYNGKPFNTPTGVSYLNISDFIKEVTRCHDMKTAMDNLCRGLPERNLIRDMVDSVMNGEHPQKHISVKNAEQDTDVSPKSPVQMNGNITKSKKPDIER